MSPKYSKLALFVLALVGGWGCHTARPTAPSVLDIAGQVVAGPSVTDLDGGRVLVPQLRYQAASDGRSLYHDTYEPRLSSELVPVPSAPPLAAALLVRYSELVGWGYPLILSYLPQGVELPRLILLSEGAVGPFTAQSSVLPFSIDTPAQSSDAAWTRLISELYVAGLINWAETELTLLGLNVGAGEMAPVRSSLDLNKQLLTAVWRDGMATYVSAHGSRLVGDGADTMAWQRRSEIGPHFMEIRAILRPDKEPREIWRELLRANASQRIFALTGAHMACRLEREIGLDGLVTAVARGPFAFYEAFMGLEPGALVSFYLPQELSPADRTPVAPRVTH